jgi:hypothetical protein
MAAPYDPEGDDLGTACLTLSKTVCEIALLHLGNTGTIAPQAVAAGGTSETESLACRQHYPKAVEETLREWDWPFATRYAVLDKVVGAEADPVNGDWVYAFRMPDDGLKVRRVVVPGIGRIAVSDPVVFRSGTEDTRSVVHVNVNAAWSDAITYEIDDVVLSGATYRCILRNSNKVPPNAVYWTAIAAWSGVTAYVAGVIVSAGGAFYHCLLPHTNHDPTNPANAAYWMSISAGFTSVIADPRRVIYANTRDGDSTDAVPTLEIEYTYRPVCAALVSDQLFKNALAWLMASKLAPSCSRNKIDAAEAFRMFQFAVQEAKTIAAQESQQNVGDDGEPLAPWHEGR